MSKALRGTFFVHGIVAYVLGALLLIVPGRTLQAIGWAPIDPIITRLLGAAVLALAWSSFRGWRARERRDVAIIVQAEIAFTVLACIGLLRHLLFANYPLVPWLIFVVFALFAIAWVVSWISA